EMSPRTLSVRARVSKDERQSPGNAPADSGRPTRQPRCCGTASPCGAGIVLRRKLLPQSAQTSSRKRAMLSLRGGLRRVARRHSSRFARVQYPEAGEIALAALFELQPAERHPFIDLRFAAWQPIAIDRMTGSKGAAMTEMPRPNRRRDAQAGRTRRR